MAVHAGEKIVAFLQTVNASGRPHVPDALPVVREWIGHETDFTDTAAATVELISATNYKVTITVPTTIVPPDLVLLIPAYQVNGLDIPAERIFEERCEISESGIGGTAWTYTLTDSVTGLPLDGADIWITSDLAGANVIAHDNTDSYGVVTFRLNAGTVYIWGRLSGYTFTNPTAASVAAGNVAAQAVPVPEVDVDDGTPVAGDDEVTGNQQLLIEWTAKGTNLSGALVATFTPDPTTGATWGVRRTDTLEEVLPVGTVLNSDGAGRFWYYITEPAYGLRYESWIKVTDGTNTVYVHKYDSGTPWWDLEGTWGSVKKWYIDESDRVDRVRGPIEGLPTDDYTDVSCNRIGNAAQRWLDNLFPMFKSSLEHWVTLAAGEEMVTLSLARYVEAVDVYDSDDGDYGSFTPIEWSTLVCGLSPDHVDETAITLPIARAEQTVFGTSHWATKAIYIAPDDTEDRVLRIRCAWYNPTLTLDSDKTFWTVNFPEHLVKAMMMLDEGFSRNTAGYNDFVLPLVQDIRQVWFNEKREEWNSGPTGRKQIG